MSALTGFFTLTRLVFRQDRFKIPLTVLALGLIFLAMVAGVAGTYKTQAEYITYASASAVSAVARAFNGPVIGATQGSVTLTETFTFFAIFVALMSTLLVVRHTRQNEEAGRSELIGATIIGRHAPLASALAAAIIANLGIGIVVAGSYIAYGLSLEGSLLAAAAMTMIGIVFAAVAAITSQLSSSARGANGLAGTAIGAAFLIRAIGDIQGTVQEGGLSVTSGWLSWISPLGIARNARPFDENQWWVIGILFLLFIVFTAIAFWLAGRRDIGAGLLPDRPGLARARPGLLSSFGLTWRLQRGLFIGWAVGLVALAISLGGVANEIGTFTSASDQAAEIITMLGGSQNMVNAYLAFSLMLCGVAIAGYSIQALMQLRSEEASGHAELILSGMVSKPSWLLSAAACVGFNSLLLLALSGVATGFTYGLTINDVWNQSLYFLGAVSAYAPAVLLFVSLTMLAFGFLPAVSAFLAWLLFAAAYLVVQFGELLKLPNWLQDISPFNHISRAPAEYLTFKPLIVMLAIALCTALIALWGFRRRDLKPS